MPSAITATASPGAGNRKKRAPKSPQATKSPEAKLSHQAVIALGDKKPRWFKNGVGNVSDHDSEASDVSDVSSIASGSGRKAKVHRRRRRQNGVAAEESDDEDVANEVIAPVMATTVEPNEDFGAGGGQQVVIGVALSPRRQNLDVPQRIRPALSNARPDNTANASASSSSKITPMEQPQWRRTQPVNATSTAPNPPQQREGSSASQSQVGFEADRRPYSPQAQPNLRRKRMEMRPWVHDGYEELESTFQQRVTSGSTGVATTERTRFVGPGSTSVTKDFAPRYLPRPPEPPWTARSPVPYLFNEPGSRAFVDVHTGDLVKQLRIRLPASKLANRRPPKAQGYLVASITFRRQPNPQSTSVPAAIPTSAAWRDKIIRINLPASKSSARSGRAARGKGVHVRYGDVLAAKKVPEAKVVNESGGLSLPAVDTETTSNVEEAIATSLPEAVRNAALAELHVQAQSGGQEPSVVAQPTEVVHPPPADSLSTSYPQGQYEAQYLPQSYQTPAYPVLQPNFYGAPVMAHPYYAPPQVPMDSYDAQYASYSPPYVPTPPPTQYFFVPARARAGVEIKAPPVPDSPGQTPASPVDHRIHRHHRHLSTVTQSAAKAAPFIPGRHPTVAHYGHTVLPPTPAFTPPPDAVHHPEAFMTADYPAYYYSPQAYGYPVPAPWHAPPAPQVWYGAYGAPPMEAQMYAVMPDAQTEDPAIISIQ